MTQIEDNKPTPVQDTAQQQAEQTEEQTGHAGHTEQTSAPPADGLPAKPQAQDEDAPAAPPAEESSEEPGAAADEQPDVPAIPATQQTILEQPEAVPPATSELAPQEHTEDVAEIPHLPDPSIWPIVIAFGISILVVGIILGLGVMLLGLLIFVGGVAGWIYQDIQIAKRGDHH